jgi:glycosyltransferase involved in cell wall biosynthesis
VSGAEHASGHPDFLVNGRFLTQRTTGVQRYAREIVMELARLAGAEGKAAALLAPPETPADPAFAGIAQENAGFSSGYVWEQLALPLLAKAPLLNLCNLGPVAVRRQVVCLHDANVFTMPEAYSRGFRAAYGVLLPLLARRAGRVTSVSQFSAGALARFLPVAAKDIVVLPNGHEHVFRWKPENSALREKLADCPPYILLIGSRALHKNVGLILGMAQALDQIGVDVIVAGGGGHIFGAERRAPARNVTFLGYVSDDDLAALMEKALALAFPSITEGFGLPIVEAMALSCPVVSSSSASMPEVCGEAALMAGCDDPGAWLAHFKALCESRDLRGDLIGAGRERVKRFSWARSAAGYLDALKNL